MEVDHSRRSLMAPKISLLSHLISSGLDKNNSNRIVINVGGARYETYKTTLKNIPDTRLSWLTNTTGSNSDYDPVTGEYFFDRHPGVFNMILNYYRTGKLHAPTDVCGPLFEEELAFWGIDEKQIEPCCWSNYRAHRDAQVTLAEYDGECICNTICLSYICLAQVFAFVSLGHIMTSILVFCMESHILFRYRTDGEDTHYISSVRDKELFTRPVHFLEITEYMCIAFFTLEILLRLSFCPSLMAYIKQFFNWLDVLAILPFYVYLLITTIDPSMGQKEGMRFLNALRLIRIFRSFRLTRYVSGLKILGFTLKASAKELLLLILVLLIGGLVFACLIYYAEQVEENSKNSFPDIPSAFWWAVVTMTTIGYGDLYPRTALGYIVGIICAVCGLLMLALPVPVIVSNFTLYYSHAQAKMSLPKKSKNRIFFQAANVLKEHDSSESGFAESDVDLTASNSNESLVRGGSNDSAIDTSLCSGKKEPGVSVIYIDEDQSMSESPITLSRANRRQLPPLKSVTGPAHIQPSNTEVPLSRQRRVSATVVPAAAARRCSMTHVQM
ncbi:hypothetical protein ACJMK2_020516 [Sinanodonta woodiana]|uniref:BTB domain-containing protein n=1 Tax=Sinanodonta woodiana TaxID=1069815 RepID=A0ABD3U281_SINWO